MIIDCSKKLAAKMPDVSATALEETSPLGGWPAHLYTIDRRQCVLSCHDATRHCLFPPGVRKEHFVALGTKWFRQLYAASLVMVGCSNMQIERVKQVLGPIRFDTCTKRSVQPSMRVARLDLDSWILRVPNLMDLDPMSVSCALNDPPATISGKSVWPERLMREMAATL